MKGSVLLPVGDCPLPLPPSYCRLPRPPCPKSAPAPDRVHRGTQIFARDWLLHDFERESRPLLELLTGRVLDAALAEVLAERRASLTATARAQSRARLAAALCTRAATESRRRRPAEERVRRERQVEAAQKAVRTGVRAMCARTAAGAVCAMLRETASDALEGRGLRQTPRDLGRTRVAAMLVRESLKCIENHNAVRKVAEKLMLECKQQMWETRARATAQVAEVVWGGPLLRKEDFLKTSANDETNIQKDDE